VVTADDTHTPAAPYQIINNDFSLLDASDLVFVDAPATGFSRVAGKDKEKAFFGVDPDAHAFAEFITGFLSRYGRWNSPKYIFGESYGTPRAAILVNLLENDYAVDVNGVIMLSQILNFDLSVDGAESNPGMDAPYVLALPTYAATAWYHHKLPGQAPADLKSLLAEVETFATLLADRPEVDLGFWKLWYFGRIPWARETVTPASMLRSPEVRTIFDGVAGKGKGL